MVRRVLLLLSFFLVLFFFGSAILVNQAQAQTQPPPRIFYTDIVSGPNVGGQSNQGAFLTIYGSNFGSTRGTSTVTIGGKPVYSHRIWSNRMLVVHVGSKAVTGNVVVNVNGVSSNGVPFTVRAGRIFFVATTGSDNYSGSYSSPWATLTKARASVTAGDIVYIMNGVQQTGADLSSASLTLSKPGTSTAPIAFVAYPGAVVTIGSATGQTYGVRSSPGSTVNWIVLAGLKIRGAITAVEMTSAPNWRLVGNDITCPNGAGTTACVSGSSAGGTKLYGNNIHDTGSTTSSSIKQYESVYFTNSNGLDIGWNEVGNTRGCDAVLIYSSTPNYNLNVHDNYIHDARCNGILIGPVDTSKGAVKATNNLVVRAGTGPAPGGIESDSYAGIWVRWGSTGTVSVTNNTFYDCGSRQDSNSGCINVDSATSFVDNIFHVRAGGEYVAPNSTPGRHSGTSNLFYGDGAAPNGFSSSVTGDPRFVNPAGNDFRLGSSSPAINKGAATSIMADMAGTPRPQGNAFDIGAYEYLGTVTPAPNTQVTATPTSHAFGSVTVGQSSTLSGTIANTSSSGSVTISAATVSGTGFSVIGLSLPVTLGAGQSANYTAKFAPTSTGTKSGSIGFVSDAANSPVAVTLSGAGTSAPVGTVSANPASIAFGSVAAGSSITRSLTLTNSGSADVSISSAGVTGSAYSISGLTTPKTLAPGQAVTFSVKFAPTSAVSSSGTVTLNSNASNSSLAIPLSGTGTTTTTPRSVDITWTVSTSTVAGYNVYRATASGGPYTKLTSSPVTGTLYTNTNVTSGTTYYYVVTSVTSGGVESAYSNQATVLVP